MSEKKTVVFKNGDYAIELTVVEAAVRQDIHREALMFKERTAMPDLEEGAPMEDLVRRSYLTVSYPTCIAATTEVKVIEKGKKGISLDMTSAEFLELPAALVRLWSTAVWELNPMWSPFFDLSSLTETEEETGSTEN